MNEITINDICENSVMCKAPYYLLNGSEGCGVFKELKTEK